MPTPRSRPASPPATPWTNAAAEPASSGEQPRARSAAIIPVSTSPVPPVARNGPPVGLIRTVPSGVPIERPAALQEHRRRGLAPRARGRDGRGRSSTSPRRDPREARELAGVRREDQVGLAIGEVLGAPRERVQAVRVEDDRDLARTDQLADPPRRALVGRHPRARRRGRPPARAPRRGEPSRPRDGPLVGLGERDEHGLADARPGSPAGCPRARPPATRPAPARYAAAAGERDRAGHQPRAADDDRVPRRALVRVGLARRHHRRDVLGLDQHEVAPDQIRRGTRSARPRRRRRTSAPGSRTSPGFGAPNVTVRSARTAAPSTAPVSPFTPEGMSTATSGTARRRERLDRLGVRALGDPAEARPEDRVDRRRRRVRARGRAPSARPRATPHRSWSRAARGCVARRARERVVQEQHGRPHARAVQVPGGDQSVAAVVPLAAHDNRAPPVRAADEPDGGVGDLAARRPPSARPRRSRAPASRDRAPPPPRASGRTSSGRPPRRTPPRSSSRG